MTPESQSFLNVVIAALLHASWQGGVLALAVLAVSAVAGRRLDPRIRFVLWLVVFARLAMPIVPAAPWSMFGWFSARPVALTIASEGASTVGGIVPRARPKPTLPDAANPSAGQPTAAAVVPRPADLATGWSISARGAAVSIWLSGVLVLVVRLALGARGLGRSQRQWQTPAAAPLCDLFEQCRRQLGLGRSVSLWISDDGVGPATLGCFRPSIVIPRQLVEQLSHADLRLVLVHELLHVRRRDVPIDRLASVVTAVHWPNPLAWLALVCLRRNRELSCDVALLDRVGGQQARHYGHLILSTLEMLPGRPLQPAAVGMFERSAGFSLSERIRLIADYRGPSHRLAVLAGVLVPLVALVGLTDAQTGVARVPEKMLADQLKAAQFQYSAVAAAYKSGTVPLDRYLASSDDLCQAELAVAKSDDERLAAQEKHVRMAKEIEQGIESLYNRGKRGGEANKFVAANYCLQSAEIELLQQQLAAKSAGDRPAREARLKQLLVERVDTARTAAMAYRAAFEAETVTLNDVVWALDARWNAELATSQNSKETLAAHVEYIQSLMQLEQVITALYNVGARGGEAEKYAAIKAARESAELELVALCIATGQTYPLPETKAKAAGAEPAPAESLGDRQKRLLAEHVESARQAKITYQAAYEAETVPFGGLIAAIDAKWQAELSVAGTPQEIIAAHVRHVQDLGDRQLVVESLYNVHAGGGEAEKVGTARYHYQAAEIALAKACLAAGQPYPQFDHHPNVTVPEPDAAESIRP